jgi:hypothetical protein
MGVSVQPCWSAVLKDSPECSATSFGSTILMHDIPSSRWAFENTVVGTPLMPVESTAKVSLSPDLGSDVYWMGHLLDRSLVLGGDDLLTHRISLIETHGRAQVCEIVPYLCGT